MKMANMKRALAILLVFASLFSIAACCSGTNEEVLATDDDASASVESPATEVSAAETGNGIKRGGVLTVAKMTNITSLDPTKSSSIDNDGFVLAQIFETLLRQDEEGNIIDGLAESYEVAEDGLSITFKLREDVVFHDGEKFNAEAAKFNLDWYISEECGHINYSSELTYVDSIDLIDEYTIRMNMSAVDASILASMTGLCGYMISPKTIKEGTIATNPAGTGAFKVKEYVEGDHVTLEAFENYYRMGEDGKPLPYLDEVVIKIMTDDAVRSANLESGDIDGVDYHGSTNSILKFENKEGFQSHTVPSVNNYFVSFNLNNEVLADIRVRQAMAYAVDRQEFIDVVLEGYGTTVPFVVRKDQWYYSDYNPYTYDPEKAKELLAEAGYADGLTVKMYYISREPDATAVQLIQAQFAEVGITMELEGMDRLAWIDLVRTQKSGELGFGVLANFGYDASRQFNSTTYYVDTTKATRLTELLPKTRASFDRDERLESLHEYQKEYLDNCYHLFVGQNQRITSYKDTVQNMNYHWYAVAKYDEVWLSE